MSAAPPVTSAPRDYGKFFLAAGTLAAVGVAAVMFFFNPAEHGFFPRCFFRMVTGWDCPGCGGLRATHQLLHGQVRAAFSLNPLLVLVLPFVVYFAARPCVERFVGLKLPQPFKGTVWIWIAAVMVVGFGVLRNFPWRQWFGQ
jgi:hypothetical protein